MIIMSPLGITGTQPSALVIVCHDGKDEIWAIVSLYMSQHLVWGGQDTASNCCLVWSLTQTLMFQLARLCSVPPVMSSWVAQCHAEGSSHVGDTNQATPGTQWRRSRAITRSIILNLDNVNVSLTISLATFISHIFTGVFSFRPYQWVDYDDSKKMWHPYNVWHNVRLRSLLSG